MWKSSLLITCMFPLLTNSFLINIDANEEHCYFERLTHGNTFTVMFEVAEGGFLDIDILISGPTNNTLYKGERETSGKYTFVADQDGLYTYCFGNKMSSMTNKALMFTIEVKDPTITTTTSQNNAGAGHETDDNHKLNEMIMELAQRLSSVKTEQEYMQVRERAHRSINESTNQRVTLWAIFEAIALILMTLGQIYYLKRFFESRFVV